ncbi:MAG: NADH/ubiquinone/plastoquinone (complex I), partial [Gammaproteobacteria bacterium]|nr:NADH/ubiquinone/plastoquinone (complex I) [Gammaproteobacteria bacterium]
AAPAPASAVLSGVMLKAGLLGWLRFVHPDVVWTQSITDGIIVLGLAGAFVGAAIGCTQSHPKTILAYSSVSQMGLVVSAFGMLLSGGASWTLAAWVCGCFAVHHALVKGALFLGVASVERLHGSARLVAMLLLAGAALSLVGVPLTSGAAAKSALLILAQGLPLGRAAAFEWMLIVGAVATALLMVRLLRCLAPGQGDGCSALLWLPAVALLVASTMFGVLVQRQLGTADSGPEKWLVAWLPVLLAVGLEALTRRSGWRMPRIPAGDLVNVVEGLARRMARESSAGREAEAGHTDGKPPARSTAWVERVVALPPRWESLLVSDYAGPWLTFAVAIGLAVVIAIG